MCATVSIRHLITGAENTDYSMFKRVKTILLGKKMASDCFQLQLAVQSSKLWLQI